MPQGRQPKTKLGRKSHYVSFRARNNLHARLAAAAEQSERSVSEEIERRLERSFEDEDRIRELSARVEELDKERSHLAERHHELMEFVIRRQEKAIAEQAHADRVEQQAIEAIDSIEQETGRALTEPERAGVEQAIKKFKGELGLRLTPNKELALRLTPKDGAK